MTHKLPQPPLPYVTDADYICSDRQRIIDLTYALRAQAGDSIMLRYQENGHITLPEVTPGKPSAGQVYVYGTYASEPSHTLRQIHHVWNESGLTDTEAGFLLTQAPFDDGRCYQVNDGPLSQQRQYAFPYQATSPEGDNVWCGINFTVPDPIQPYSKKDLECRVLSIYWVWDWPGTNTNETAEQYYTTCLDIVVGAAGTEAEAQ